MANLSTDRAKPYHVKQTLGGSCWLAALSCAMGAKLRTPGKPSENDLKLVCEHLKIDYEYASEESWIKMRNYLNGIYSGKAEITIADWGKLPDSTAVRDLIKATVNGCGAVILSYHISDGLHDVGVLGIESVGTSNPLDDKLTECDPEADAPQQTKLNAFWEAGIKYIVTVT